MQTAVWGLLGDIYSFRKYLANRGWEKAFGIRARKLNCAKGAKPSREWCGKLSRQASAFHLHGLNVGYALDPLISGRVMTGGPPNQPSLISNEKESRLAHHSVLVPVAPVFPNYLFSS
jgi:hypothetical protein